MSLTAYEQYLLELINRARLDPLAEATRYGLPDLNRGQSTTITTASKQPLAGNQALDTASTNHSAYMLANQSWGHSNIGDGTPSERAVGAGYGSTFVGENISRRGTTGTLDLLASIESHHRGLFLSDGHRANILREDYRELGLGQEIGVFQGFNTSMLTEKFGTVFTGGFFLTGVAYNDADGNDFYSLNEGQNGHSVSIAGGGTAQTAAAGGYSIEMPTTGSSFNVTYGSMTVNVTNTGQNIKLDFVNFNEINISESVNGLSGVAIARLLGVANLTLQGGTADETLIGNKGDNTIRGSDGNDTIIGGAGADTLDGQGGFNTASFVGSVLAVSVSLHSNNGWTGDATGDTYANFQSIIGSANSDFLTGSNDHNVIEGGAGADNINGLLGNDWLSYENAGSGVAINIGSNVGWAGDATGDVVAEIENIRGSAHNDFLYGDSQSNILLGAGGGDVLYGGANSDTVDYSTSQSAVNVNLSTNSATGGDAQGDTLVSIENVFGSTGNDVLVGDSASNTLVGSTGIDALTGNGGNDIFRWSTMSDSGTAFGGRDVVTDFSQSHGDLLDFSGIDAVNGGANDAFNFLGASAFTNTAGQLRFFFEGGNTVVELDVNGDGAADLQVQLTGNISLTATDFIL